MQYNECMFDTKITRTIQRNDFCADLPEEVAQIFLANEKTVTAPKGAQLLTRGKYVQHLILLKSGSVQISLADAGCESPAWTIDRAGHVFGMHSLISGECSEMDVTCIQKCDVGLFERSFFLTMLKIYPEIYFAVSRILSLDLRIADRMFLDRRQKVNARTTLEEHCVALTL